MKKTIIDNDTCVAMYDRDEASVEYMASTYVGIFDGIKTDDNYLDFVMDVIIDGFGLDK